MGPRLRPASSAQGVECGAAHGDPGAHTHPPGSPPAGGKAAAGRRRGVPDPAPSKKKEKHQKNKQQVSCWLWLEFPSAWPARCDSLGAARCLSSSSHRMPSLHHGPRRTTVDIPERRLSARCAGLLVRRGRRQGHPPAPPARDTRGSAGCFRGGDAPLGRPRRGYPLPDATERSRGGGGHSA